MAASTKAQLGARVSPELREAVVARAKSEGVSLNVWVERTLGAALVEGQAKDSGSPPASPSRSSAPRRAPATRQAFIDAGPSVRDPGAMSRAEIVAAQCVADAEASRKARR